MRVGCGFGFGGGEELQAGGRAMMMSKAVYPLLHLDKVHPLECIPRSRAHLFLLYSIHIQA